MVTMRALVLGIIITVLLSVGGSGLLVWATSSSGTQAGAQGDSGEDGVDGAPGADGVDGAPGADGAPGTDGADGAPGSPGLRGLTGPTGPTGPQGLQGVPGPQGLQGVPGPQGAQGVAGPQGPQGAPASEIAFVPLNDRVPTTLTGCVSLFAALPSTGTLAVDPGDISGVKVPSDGLYRVIATTYYSPFFPDPTDVFEVQLGIRIANVTDTAIASSGQQGGGSRPISTSMVSELTAGDEVWPFLCSDDPALFSTTRGWLVVEKLQ